MLRLQSFTENLERIGGAVVVVLLGSMLRAEMLSGDALFFGAVLFFIVRPLSVYVGLAGSSMSWLERTLASWFGIRGMASLYYLAYGYANGVSRTSGHRLAGPQSAW